MDGRTDRLEVKDKQFFLSSIFPPINPSTNQPMSITIIIIIVTVIASFYAWNNPSVQQKWMMNPYDIAQRNEYWRFITSGFIHSDYTHLFFNMLTLYFFGEIVEHIYYAYFGEIGNILFVALYLSGIVASDIPTYLKHRKNPHYNSLGASGGVSAVVFSGILFNPIQPLCLYFAICMPGFIFGTLYMLYSYFQAKRGGDYINHDAHLYGAFFGIGFSILIMPGVLMTFFHQVINWRMF
jgi:membrane associated rhomboid family serine protease